MQAGVQLSKKADSFYPEYFTWEAGSNRVNLRLDVVSEIHTAFQSQDQQVQPLFGLLIGSLGANRVVTIDGFEATDPGGDGEKLRRALARWDAKVDPQRSVVGYCRSETGDTFALTDQDVLLLSAHFTRLLDVVMLVKHSFGSTPTGGFFFAELGEARSRFCLGRFPLDPTRLATTHRSKTTAEPAVALAPAAPVLVPVVPPSPAPHPVASVPATPPAEPKNLVPEVHVIAVETAPEPAAQVESGSISPEASPVAQPVSIIQVALSKPLILASAAFCAVAVLAAGWYLRSSAPKEAVTVALTASRTAEGIDVRWDRNAPVFTQQGALLMIREGELQKDLYLDLAQLRTGHVIYYPQTKADLHLRLDVFAASEKAASQSMVIVGPGAAQQSTETAAAVPAQSPGPDPAQTTAQVPTASINVPASQPPGPVVVSQSSAVVSVPEAAPQPAQPVPPAEAKRAFLPPPVQHEAGTAVAVVNPPDLQTSSSASSNIDLIPTPGAVAPPAPAVPSQPFPKGPAPVAARVIKRVMPVIPPDARTWKVTQEVAVLVKIDLEGKVTNAVIEDARTPAANMLTRAALDAARQWRFEPARRGGQPVATEMVLRFHF